MYLYEFSLRLPTYEIVSIEHVHAKIHKEVRRKWEKCGRDHK